MCKARFALASIAKLERTKKLNEALDEVVLVDPTKMRLIALIGPKPKQR